MVTTPSNLLLTSDRVKQSVAIFFTTAKKCMLTAKKCMLTVKKCFATAKKTYDT